MGLQRRFQHYADPFTIAVGKISARMFQTCMPVLYTMFMYLCFLKILNIMNKITLMLGDLICIYLHFIWMSPVTCFGKCAFQTYAVMLLSSFCPGFRIGAIDGVEILFCNGIRLITKGTRFRFAVIRSKSRYE